ncbi:MAG: hypothetical protein K0V04_28975 [Deltaproteobacteria bacterium]|nr:hypothetical protein [Deltaproteobacteria bacterium]
MQLLLRAIITGFGYKLGAEIGRYVATRIGLVDKQQAKTEEAEEDLPDGLPITPPGGEGETEEDGEAEAQRVGEIDFDN